MTKRNATKTETNATTEKKARTPRVLAAKPEQAATPTETNKEQTMTKTEETTTTETALVLATPTDTEIAEIGAVAKAAEPKEKAVPSRLRNASAASIDLLRAVLDKAGIEYHPEASRLALLAAGHDKVWGDKGNVVPEEHKARYGSDGNCGDDVAETLAAHCRVPVGKGKQTALDVGLLEAVATMNGVDLGRWKHLNVGMQRMNLGNVLRGKAKRGEYVVIGASEWNKPAATQAA